MSGLCGWVGSDLIPDPAETIGRMARALPNHGLTQTNDGSGPNFGLALRTHPATGAFTVEPGILVAVEGYPEWRDSALKELAQNSGHARALLAAYRRHGAGLTDEL